MKKIILLQIISLLVIINTATGFRVSSIQCPEDKFQCDSFKCIPKRWVCDGSPDCNDESDEQPGNCLEGQTPRPLTCKDSQFRCDNGYCLPLKWKCDGTDDCGDNSDESKDICHFNCSDSEFTCKDGQCVSQSWRCDGHADCADASDEVNCTSMVTDATTVSHKSFRCGEGFYIPIMWRCDGDFDCEDHSDENNCDLVENPSNKDENQSHCRSSEFQCPDSFCILRSWVCDGMNDCPNGEDEVGCKHNSCKSDEFRCEDGTACVNRSRMCDGINHCLDNSDEKNCPPKDQAMASSSSQSVSTNATSNSSSIPAPTQGADCDLESNYKCPNGACISKSKLCDGKGDCIDSKDESVEVCGINECERNNGGCMHECIDKRYGHECACASGYRLVGKYNCEDVDECAEIPGTCSQICMNYEGGFGCSCLSGYLRDPADHKRCKASEGEAYLLFSHSYDIRSLRLHDRDMTSVVRDTRNAIALDYLYAEGKILWSDKKENKIFRASLSDTTYREVLVTHGDVSADGLAVDWVHRLVYYTDSLESSVKLMSWDAKYVKTIVTEEVGRPRAIALAPIEGYVYWTDWGTHAKIERSALDGSDRQAIVTEPHVEWPNGLTIDPSTSKIFWCDGRLRAIRSADLDGSNIKVVLYSPTYLRQPFSISVFEDKMYWTDWTKAALFSANKFTGNDIQNVTAGHMLESPKVVHVYHQYRQPEGENVCAYHSCSHFCTRNLVGDRVCLCADDFVLEEDGVTCVKEGSLITTTIAPFIAKLTDMDINDSSEKDVGSIEEGFTLYQEAERRSQVGFIIGGCFGAIIAIAAVMALYFVWSRTRSRPIKRIRFHNPIYRKTTSEVEDSRGFVIGQDHLLFSPSPGSVQLPKSDPRLTDRDDEPLTPKEDDDDY